MTTLRILSWNLRTFGDPCPVEPALCGMVEIMLQSEADVICIQEVQSGYGPKAKVGINDPIAQHVVSALDAILVKLIAADPRARWTLSYSALNNSHQSKTVSYTHLTLPTIYSV